MDKTTVAIRDFRASLAEYIDADAPVTITRHGRAIGLFALGIWATYRIVRGWLALNDRRPLQS